MECNGYFQRTSQEVSRGHASSSVACPLWIGMWLDSLWEKRLCPELFHSMIISVKAKKTWSGSLFYLFIPNSSPALRGALGGHQPCCPGTAMFPSWKKGFRVIFEMQQKTPHFLQSFDSCIFHLGQGLKFSATFKESFGFPCPHVSIPEQSSLKICGANSWNFANVLSQKMFPKTVWPKKELVGLGHGLGKTNKAFLSLFKLASFWPKQPFPVLRAAALCHIVVLKPQLCSFE